MKGVLARFSRGSSNDSSASARTLRFDTRPLQSDPSNRDTELGSQNPARSSNAARQISKLVAPESTPESEREALEKAIKNFECSCSNNVKQCALELALHFVIKKQDENTPTLNQAFTPDDVNTLRALIQVSERSLQVHTHDEVPTSLAYFTKKFCKKMSSLSDSNSEHNPYQKINRLHETFLQIANTYPNAPSNTRPSDSNSDREPDTSRSDLPPGITHYLEKIFSNQYLKNNYPKLIDTLQSPEGPDESGVGDGVDPKVLSISL